VRLSVGPILVLFLLSCVLLAGYYASQTVYFVGTSNDGFVTVYRGLPYDLPAGVDLYSVNYESGVPVDDLTAAQRRTITAHKVRSKDDAQDLVRQLETGELAAR
jgi:protein phosphatase